LQTQRPAGLSKGTGGGGQPTPTFPDPERATKFISARNPQRERVVHATPRAGRFPVPLNEAYDPPAVNSLKLGDDYEEAPRARRFRVVASPRVVCSGTLHRRPCLARAVDPRETYSLDDYLTSLQQSTKPLIDEQKKQGTIMDYKIFLKETKNGPEDWDICVAIEYKNHAAMDGLAAKGEAARDKILGGKAQGQQLAEKRVEIREIISSELMQEIFLK
jgi:hypothetical protein